MSFAAHKQAVMAELGWKAEDVELWLFHGTDAVNLVLEGGFRSSHADLKKNKYGAGAYFARDPRCAQYFL